MCERCGRPGDYQPLARRYFGKSMELCPSCEKWLEGLPSDKDRWEELHKVRKRSNALAKEALLNFCKKHLGELPRSVCRKFYDKYKGTICRWSDDLIFRLFDELEKEGEIKTGVRDAFFPCGYKVIIQADGEHIDDKAVWKTIDPIIKELKRLRRHRHLKMTFHVAYLNDAIESLEELSKQMRR